MSVLNPERIVTKQDLKDFYDGILPYLGGNVEAGFTPIGTIIAVMGNSAPTNYLACNGQVVNIADYPELANYFLAQFGSRNYFGGNGTTTFGIPDLRGEFLRGTGTNSHTGNGNGADVGTHQNGTVASNGVLVNNTDGSFHIPMYSTTNWTATYSPDYQIKSNGGVVYGNSLGSIDRNNNADIAQFTVRPTNTSVLYCIATKNIYMNPALSYTEEEQVVGQWISGKPIYQKTYNETVTTYSDDTYRRMFVSSTISDVDTIVKAEFTYEDSSYMWNGATFVDGNTASACVLQRNVFAVVDPTTHKLSVRHQSDKKFSITSVTFLCTVQYTKTTD